MLKPNNAALNVVISLQNGDVGESLIYLFVYAI